METTTTTAPMEPVEREGQGVAVVAVPFFAHSHLNQLLHLCLRLSGRGLPVHYAAFAAHVRQAKSQLQGWDAGAMDSIRFHELVPLPPPAAGSLCDPNSVDSTDLSSSIRSELDAFEQQLQAPLASLLRSVAATASRLVVVHDPLAAFAATEASLIPIAEAYAFSCVPAVYRLIRRMKDKSDVEDLLRARGISIPSLDGSVVTKELADFASRQLNLKGINHGMLINSCRAIEGEFIDLLARHHRLLGKNLFAIAPLSPMISKNESRRRQQQQQQQRHECLKWLDEQPPSSVVYVAFGTLTSLAADQVEQLATGLKRSGERFIWVLRDADDRSTDIFAGEEDEARRITLLQDLEVEGTGVIIRGWAPQAEILAHPSTAAFMSHCGWNSCLESLSMGVPILAWPMHTDQPINAMLVTEYLKVGFMVMEWPRREAVVAAKNIEKSIKRVMVYDEGEEIKMRAKDLGNALQKAASEGGSSCSEIDSFVAHITR